MDKILKRFLQVRKKAFQSIAAISEDAALARILTTRYKSPESGPSLYYAGELHWCMIYSLKIFQAKP